MKKKTLLKAISYILISLLILFVKDIPKDIKTFLTHKITLFVMGGIIILLIYVDIILALLLALFIIMVIKNTSPQDALGRYLPQSFMRSSQAGSSDNPMNNNLIPGSSYGGHPIQSWNDLNTMTKEEKAYHYKKQIGKLGETTSNREEAYSEADDKYVTFQKDRMMTRWPMMVAKEGFNALDASYSAMSSITDNKKIMKEGFTTSSDTVHLGKEMDHPATKTITENLRARKSGYITDKNLLDIQINTATGNPNEPVDCIVESIKDSLNAQGFKRIVHPRDNFDSDYSFVV